MAQRDRPLETPGVEGEKAEGKIEFKQGEELFGKVRGQAEGRLDQTSDLDGDIRHGGDVSREAGSRGERDSD